MSLSGVTFGPEDAIRYMKRAALHLHTISRAYEIHVDGIVDVPTQYEQAAHWLDMAQFVVRMCQRFMPSVDVLETRDAITATREPKQ